MSRAETLTSYLKRYDAELYAELAAHNLLPTKVIYILRRNRSRPHEPHFIFALTRDWTAKTEPREWGIEVVLARLRAMDLWKSETVVDRVIADAEKAQESKDRDAKNNIESFLREFRREFARSTNQINTSNLAKTDARRRGDLKYGNSK